MSDPDTRVAALLEQLVDLQTTANEQQRQALQQSEKYYVDARARTEIAIELQKVAVARQRRFFRVWLGLIVFIVAAAVALLLALSRYPH